MTEPKMPDRDRAAREPEHNGEERSRERASRPEQEPGFDEHEAARRQARQDPLQKRDR